MNCPDLRVVEYGLFDSQLKFPKEKISRERISTEYELEFYFDDCKGKSVLNGEIFPIEKGVFILAGPGTRRQSYLPYTCSYFHFQTEDPALSALLAELPLRGRLRHVGKAEELFRRLVTWEGPQEEKTLFLFSALFQLILFVREHLLPPQEENFLHGKRLLEAEHTLRSAYHTNLTLQTLAAEANLSPIYFHKLFTRFFGKTPGRFLLECRIAAAKEALLSVETPLTRIAQECGFSSQAYFCSKFKEYTGMTPLQYRKEMLGRGRLSPGKETL